MGIGLDYAFVGGGNMGYALAAAVVRRGVCAPAQILVADPAPEARKRAQALGCATSEHPTSSGARVVVLAVKPQQAADAMVALAGELEAGQVIVSIMAGVAIAAIQKALGHKAVVRVMPNTPAQVGLGMNVYHADPAVTATQLAPVDAMLKAAGDALQVSTEDLIDAATAVSGSGPAYVFYLAEHWMRAAQGLGFTEAQAAQLVRQTLRGATELWQQSALPPGMLREQVTSKGGTTAAALDAMNAAGVGPAIETGVRRAYERAKELGR
jgi:pyrroline-5-carboxylate reductase